MKRNIATTILAGALAATAASNAVADSADIRVPRVGYQSEARPSRLIEYGLRGACGRLPFYYGGNSFCTDFGARRMLRADQGWCALTKTVGGGHVYRRGGYWYIGSGDPDRYPPQFQGRGRTVTRHIAICARY